MLKNYLKTAFRSLARNKIYGLLNIVGLGLGIGCALVIFKVISFENSFDKHQDNYASIYRVVHEEIRPDEVSKGMGTPHPLGPAILEDFPEVKKVVRTHYVGTQQINVRTQNEVKKFLLDDGIVFTENGFFDVFNVEFISGDPGTALTESNTGVISKSESRRLFGYQKGEESKAVGRMLNLSNKIDFEVVGVIDDPVEATNFPFTILIEYRTQAKINQYFQEGQEWNSTSSNTNTYLLVAESFDSGAFDEKLIDFVDRHYKEGESVKRKFQVQPLSDVHSNTDYDNYAYVTSNELISALAAIAVFLILTACINFINLATAQAAKRSKEIGIRKALGGYSRQLVIQFLAETTLITFIALLCSLVVSEFLFIQLEDVIDTRLELNLFQNIETIGFLFALLVTVSLLSGFYPSFLLAGMNTVMALKSKITAKNNSGGLGLRKVLVITQFTISQFLIIGTVIISSQMSFFMTKDLGFEKEAIVKTYLPETDEVKSERFRSLMQENSAISGVTFALSSPSGTSNAVSIFNYPPLESEQDYMANYKPVDEHYMDLYGLDLIAGRNIKKSDSGNYVIINRKTADLLGFKDNYDEVVGEQLSSGWRGYRLKVIGVMENFHSQDLSGGLQYVFLLNEPETYFEIAFKTLEGSNVKQAISHFESVWDQVYPEYVVDWQFYDEELAENYEQEQSVSTLMSIFSIVSIAIGCLGLYGLIAFITANRTKEVGIRKALGAPVVAIIGKFTREIFILIVISFLIAAPVAFFILNEWLNDYEFRIKIGFGFFAMAFIATLLIAALTVGYRTISTAQLNPAQTLKDE